MTRRHPDEEELIRLALGDLESPAGSRIDEHLAQCPACRAAADSIRQIIDSAHSEREPAPDGVLVRLLLASATRRPRRGFLFPAPRLAVAAMFFTVFFFAGFWTGRISTPMTGGPAGTLRIRSLPNLPEAPFQAVPALDLRPASGIPAGWVGNSHDSTAGDSL